MEQTMTMNIAGVTIQYPGIQTNGTGIVINTDNGLYTNTDNGLYTITLDDQFLISIAMSIVRKEMDQIRKKSPECDISRMNTMINSGDREMVELGMKVLSEYSRYSNRIVASLQINDMCSLKWVVDEYIRNNKFNLMEEIL